MAPNQHTAYPVEELKRAVLDAPSVTVTGNRDLVNFVRVWQSAQSIKVVSQKTKIPPETASMIAVRMRRHGIPLKPFQRRGWNNRLLRELGRYCNTTGQPAHFVVGPMRRRIAYLEAQVEKLEQKLRARA